VYLANARQSGVRQLGTFLALTPHHPLKKSWDILGTARVPPGGFLQPLGQSGVPIDVDHQFLKPFGSPLLRRQGRLARHLRGMLLAEVGELRGQTRSRIVQAVAFHYRQLVQKWTPQEARRPLTQTLRVHLNITRR